jgi:hypothetical protein
MMVSVYPAPSRCVRCHDHSGLGDVSGRDLRFSDHFTVLPVAYSPIGFSEGVGQGF